jgi:hypothetical protein
MPTNARTDSFPARVLRGATRSSPGTSISARMTSRIALAGYVGLLAAGYAYNLTFVQLGLTALGRDGLGLAEAHVAAAMGGLAIGTCLVALAVGWMISGWRLRGKLTVAAGAVTAQTALTAVVALVATPLAFTGWLVAAAFALGAAVPATFGLATDLVPVRSRGHAAAAVTALAYAGAIAFLADWDAVELGARLAPPMAAGSAALALLALAPGPLRPLVERLERQADEERFAQGRFVAPGVRRRLIVAAVLLFGVFFVDSLGFVRLVDTAYIAAAWQSPETLDRAALVAAHVAGALVAGLLYTSFDERFLLPWIFGIFALVALMYVTDIRLGIGGPSQVLVMPVLYAVGVSLYTVLTFALWPDLSTPDTVTRNVAVGVALSAWTATFLSTALAMAWRTAGVDLDRHFSSVAAVALLVLAAMWLRQLVAPARGALP